MKKKLVPIAAAALLATNVAEAQTNIYLELDGIEGESVSANYADQIDVISWGWGLSNNVSVEEFASGAGTQEKTTFQSLKIDKILDSSSPPIYEHIAARRLIKGGTLTTTIQAGGAGEVEYSVLDMDNVFIVAAQPSGSDGIDGPTESISLLFSRFCITQNTIDAKGSVVNGTPFCWDIAENKAF